ncbi:hypothetical protein C0J52_15800, partial [Blattella germanica]
QTIANGLTIRLTVLPYPLYSPNLVPRDYALFDSMKEVMWDKFTTKLQTVVQY